MAEPVSQQPASTALREALHGARIEAAERTGVVVDLRDAELARLELLNEALEPLFKEIPAGVDLFDRGVSRGDTPRLWIDVVAHVAMGRDKRIYRLVQDTRYGRAVLAESYELPAIVRAVTNYVARRMVERERALSADASFNATTQQRAAELERRSRRWSGIKGFVLGAVLMLAALFAFAVLSVR
jgi:hypothetical protein